VPITHVATEELKLNTHVIDTFTGWAPPVPINLVVAVSFGLFVPPRILGLAKYGGLNVHPSLLPDLRGPAPIEHALLKHRPRTGVSIQTLHPEHFDEGAVLAQTAEPWTQIPHDITRLALEEQLASAGAHMLVDVLKAQQYIPPHKDAGWYASSGGPVEHAPKITKQDRFIDFAQTSLDEILTIQRALGEPWCILPNGDRLILHQVTEASTTLWAAPEQADADDQQPGIFLSKDFTKPLFRAACGALGIIETSTYAGSNSGGGNAKLMRIFSTQEGEEVSAP
jgi:methionyl-tRNA formyltransferase